METGLHGLRTVWPGVTKQDPDSPDMIRPRTALVLALFCLGFPCAARAQSLTVSSDPVPLVVATAVPGHGPEAVVESSTTYAVATGATTSRIQARLSAPLPPGVILELRLEPPPGAVDLGPVALTTMDQDVVLGVPPGTSASGLRITYTLSATVTAGVVAGGLSEVTFTLATP